MFLNNDIVIANLLIKLIEKDITNIMFFDIYNFSYFIHFYLSHNTDMTEMIMVSKDDIIKFVDMNTELEINGEMISIIDKEILIEKIKNNYSNNENLFEKAFDFAFSKVFN